MRPTPDAALAAALSRARQAARDDIVRSQDISRGDRELLASRKWLREIIRGWYLLTTSEAQEGDTVIWHSSFWAFVGAYFRERFGRRYCLSAEASLDLWSGAMGTPTQLTVLTTSGGTSRIELPTGTSILTYENERNLPMDIVELDGVQLMSLGTALVRTTPTFFHLDPLTAEIALKKVRREDLARAARTFRIQSAAFRSSSRRSSAASPLTTSTPATRSGGSRTAASGVTRFRRTIRCSPVSRCRRFRTTRASRR